MATNWLKRTQDAFDTSTEYLDQNCRADWDYSLRAFRNEHASGSKYLSEEYKARSRLFRPKTRSVIRKNEAAAAVALFSNMEIVDLQPGNPDDPMSVAARDALKAVLEYRLTRTLPTFQICMGGMQDAQTQGLVCSYQYWKYETRGGRKTKDEPCIELRPIENIRIDGGADWLNPVESSPYFFDVIPMYVCDVRAMMDNKDPKTKQPKWKKYDDSVITRALPDEIDSTRKSRLGNGTDPQKEKKSISDFDTVWVLRCFMRDSQGVDYTYYSLGTEALLTDPKPIEDVYFHGKRPYVIGYSILETHRVFKTSMPMLVKPLQLETTDVANQRLDNVKFVLNKRWLVARGRQVDVQSLVRNVPGGVTLVTDPKTDVQESNWADVTSSAYVEQDRISADFDDLAGNFSPSTKVANNAVNDTLGGSKMASMGAGMMTDYLLRTIIETWWEPVLRQLVLLEQHYETDEVVLKLAAQKARLLKNHGLFTIGDDLLTKEVLLNVNVGMGSSNPQQRMQNFLMATTAANQIIATAPPGANVPEMIKEIFSNAGYRDGTRFFGEQQDPRLMKAMQVIQKMQAELQGKRGEIAAQGQIEQLKLASNEKIKGAEIQVNNARIEGELGIKRAELVLESQRIELERLKLQIESMNQGQDGEIKKLELDTKREESALKLEGERQKLQAQAMKIAGEIQSAALDLARAKQESETQERETQATEKASQSTTEITSQVKELKAAVDKVLEERQKKSGPRKVRVKSGDEVFDIEVA